MQLVGKATDRCRLQSAPAGTNIRLQFLLQRRGQINPLAGRCQQIEDQLDAGAVMLNQFAAGHGDGLPCHLRSDKGIAVAIAADPGAEPDHLRQIIRLDFDAIFVAQRAGNFFEQLRQRFKDGNVVIIETEFDFILYGGPMAANFIGLPQSRDLRQNVLFAAGEFLILQGNLIQAFESFADDVVA